MWEEYNLGFLKLQRPSEFFLFLLAGAGLRAPLLALVRYFF